MMSLLVGDALKMLKILPDKIVRMCVTSPPYWGLRDYGVEGQLGLEKTPEEYVSKLVEIFREVKRVLRDDGTLWLNLGDSYARQAGDDSTKKPESINTGQRGVLEAGCIKSGCNKPPPGLKPKDLVGIPWLVAFALRADGWYLRQDIIWHKPNPMPESVRDRCTKAHEYIFMLSKRQKYYYDSEAIKENQVGKPHAPGNKTLTQPTQKGFRDPAYSPGRVWASDGKRNRRSVWTVSTRPFKAAHFATFPPDLIEPCILAGSAIADIVLDPFMGSGTTAIVAEYHKRHWIGIEISPEYAKIINARLRQGAVSLAKRDDVEVGEGG